MNLKKNSSDNRHIVTLTVNELQEALFNSVRAQIEKLLETQLVDHESESKLILFTRMEVADIFKISTVSLDKWKKAGLLPSPIKMAGRVYYLKTDIEELIKNRKHK